jgi:thiamine kinase-like enzyme
LQHHLGSGIATHASSRTRAAKLALLFGAVIKGGHFRSGLRRKDQRAGLWRCGVLNEAEVIPYLLTRGLITPKCVVEGNVAILDTSRRNHNFKVISPAGCYLLKQAVGLDRAETISHEAGVLQILSLQGRRNELARYLPKFYAYDAEQHILILELVQGVETLREQHERSGRASAHTAEQVADALAALHRVTDLHVGQNGKAFTQRLPVLSLYQPDLKIFRTISSAGVQLIKIIQRQKQLGELLDQLREELKSQAFIHGDVRGDNFLIPTGSASGRKRLLKIVDFEYACLGHPAWDVGSVFAEYLSFWLFSIPIIGGAQPDRFLALASCPLEKVQPSIRSFWRRYAVSMRLEQSKSDQSLLLAVKYCGARLLNMAFEMTVAANSISAHMLCLVQVGMNVLLEPEKAAAELLGIQFPGGTA